MNNIKTLEHPTLNGLTSLNLDELTTDDLTASNLVSNNIDGNYFSIDTIEALDIQVDQELELTESGYITIGKGLPGEITITDTEVGYLDGVTSNIQDQIDSIDNDTTDLEARITVNEGDISTNTANIATNTADISTNTANIATNTADISTNTNLLTNVINIEDVSFQLKDSEVMCNNGPDNNFTVTALPNYVWDEFRPTFTSQANHLDAGQNEDTIKYSWGVIGSNIKIEEHVFGLVADTTAVLGMHANGKMYLSNNMIFPDSTEQTTAFTDTKDTQLSTNTSNIATNTSNISTNTSNIATNTSNIATNTSNIATNTTDIATNTSNIATNTTNISTNTTDIATINSAITSITTNDITFSKNVIVKSSGYLLGGGSSFQMKSYSGYNIVLDPGTDYIDLYGQTVYMGNGSGVTIHLRSPSVINMNSETQNYAFTNARKTQIETNTSDISTLQGQINPTGAVIAFAGSSIPTGYLLCDGAEISQTTYADLYTAIGTTYSSGRSAPSSGNFYLPDLRCTFISGVGQNQTQTQKITQGAKTLGTFYDMSVQGHKHDYEKSDSESVGTPGVSYITAGANTHTTTKTSGIYFDDGTSMTAAVTQPINLAMNYIIKY